jgi:signal transduction histidine kinase
VIYEKILAVAGLLTGNSNTRYPKLNSRFMFKSLSLRNKQLLSFLVLVLLMVIIAAVSYWSYVRRDNLGNVFGGLEQVSVKTIQTIEYEKDFLLYDAVDQNFFETNKSEYLAQHKTLMSEIRNDLQRLRILTLKVGYNIIPELDTISHYINRHEIIFKQIVDLTKLRGFRDYGLEGDMRNFAHQLESDPLINQVSLLSLRRREKDYILRKDSVYIQMFSQITDDLLTGFAKIPQTERGYQTRQTLLNYKAAFLQLVKVEQQIGINNNSGIRKQLREESFYAQRQLRATVAKTNAEFEVLIEQLQSTFFIIVGLAIVGGIVVSYVLTGQVTKATRELSAHINQTVNQGFSTQIKPQPMTVITDDEIGDLARNFNIMTEKIYRDMQEISEKSKTLEVQNDELQLINSRLSSSESRLLNLVAVKDKFFSIISHDMRGPLTTLAGFLEMFKNYADSFTKTELEEFTESMNTSVKRIINMLENLLQWSRSQMGSIVPHPEPFAIHTLLENNVKLLGQTAEKKRIRLNLQSDPQLMVEADKNMLDFVLRNLISNALKFTYTGGEVRVVAETYAQTIRIAVRDTGVGITAEDVDRIFEPDTHFSTPGTNSEMGTGLGLMLCKDFVEKNGGTLQVESTLGQGTLVTFTIPAVKKERFMPDIDPLRQNFAGAVQ